MAKRDFEYYGPDREPLCGECVDKLFGDVHACGGVLADGRRVSWQYAPEHPHNCDHCGKQTVGEGASR